MQLQVGTKCRCFPFSTPSSSFEADITPSRPQRNISGSLCRLQHALLTALFPLFLLQSSRTREVHQVSIWATPLLPSPGTNALCSEVVPSGQPSFRPVLMSCAFWEAVMAPLGSSATHVQAHPGVSSSCPLSQAPCPFLPSPQSPGLVHPGQDPGNDCCHPSFSGN